MLGLWLVRWYTKWRRCLKLEVDLEYPIELHDLHAHYPLAPENLKVSADMVSDFSKQIYSHYHDEKPCRDENIKKLILSVQDKTN